MFIISTICCENFKQNEVIINIFFKFVFINLLLSLHMWAYAYAYALVKTSLDH